MLFSLFNFDILIFIFTIYSIYLINFKTYYQYRFLHIILLFKLCTHISLYTYLIQMHVKFIIYIIAVNFIILINCFCWLFFLLVVVFLFLLYSSHMLSYALIVFILRIKKRFVIFKWKLRLHIKQDVARYQERFISREKRSYFKKNNELPLFSCNSSNLSFVSSLNSEPLSQITWPVCFLAFLLFNTD